MPKTSATPLLREVRHLIGAGGRDDVSDGQLLDRFVADRDEAAFEVLVRRYGRLVFGVCRRVLADPHSAEDAFQATFLVLVHKAGSLDRRRPVADWLYTVAFRLALRARANAARRREVETDAVRNRPEPAPEDELAAAVHEELNRLPERHRVPLVLSYLEGRSYEQVARAIGCPVGSVGWRLEKARDALRDRLVGRGLTGPAAAVLAALATSEAAAVPASVVQATVRAGVWFASGPAAGAGMASAEAIELARGVVGAMTTNKLTVAAGVLLAVGLCGGTAWLSHAPAMPDEPRPVAAKPADAKPAEAGPAAQLGTTNLRHGEAIFFIAYTPDGKHILTAGSDKAIKLWDRQSGREVRAFDRTPKAKELNEAKPAEVKMMAAGVVMATPAKFGAPSNSFPVALSPDGALVAAGRDSTLFVWEVETGKKLHEITTSAALTDLHFTPSGKALVATDMNGDVTLWDPKSGTAGRSFKTDRMGPEGGAKVASDLAKPITTGAAVSPDARYVVQQVLDRGAGSAVLRVRDLETGKQVSEIKTAVGGVQGLTFSPDGKRVAWSSFLDGVVVWDLAADKEVARLGRDPNPGPPRIVTSCRFSADGNTLAVALQGDAIELWDVPAAKRLRTIGGHEPERGAGFIKVAALNGRNQLTRHDLAFAPDGKTVAASLGGTSVRQFDTGTGDELATAPGHATAVIAVGSDGRTVTTVSKESVRVWDAATGRAVRDWPLDPTAGAAAVSPDGKRVATASGGTVRLWDPATGAKVRDIDTRRPDVAGLGFSPDGKLVATREGVTSAISLWDVATSNLVRTIGQEGESPFASGVVKIDSLGGSSTPAVAFSSDGRLLAAVGEKKQVCVWDVATGVLVREVTPATPAGTAAFAFSANGQNLAVLSPSGWVTVHEVATGGKRYEFTLPLPKTAAPGGQYAMAGVVVLSMTVRGNADAGGVGFTPDGRLAYSGAGGPVVRVWDVLTGREITQLKGHQGSVTHLRLAPDGRHLISGSMDTTARVWDLGSIVRAEVPAAPADLDALWQELAKADAAAGHAAVRNLLADRPAAVSLVKERVKPVPAADEEKIARLIADLGGKFDARRKATAELEQLGELAVPQLRKALEGQPPLDLKQRLERLVEKATVQQLDGDRLRALRAVEVLELAGTPEARQALEGLAKGAAGARLTQDAKAAAERMGRKIN